MSGALEYSILNKIFRLLQTAVDVEDTVTIESHSINVTYKDIKAGRLYPVYLDDLPDRCCILHTQLKVETPFSTSTNPVIYAQFHLGLDEKEKIGGREQLSKYGLLYNGLTISSPGIFSPNGILFKPNQSRIINYGQNKLVAYFSILGTWSVVDSVTYARGYASGAGTSSSALIVGGSTYIPYNVINSSEMYSGSSWVVGGTPLRSHVGGALVGSNNTSCLMFAGKTAFSDSSTVYSLNCAYYDGVVWHDLGDIFPQRVAMLAYAGVKSSALAISGLLSGFGNSQSTFEYNNVSWSAAPQVNIARSSAQACGLSSYALLTGGSTSQRIQSTSETYNGVSWSMSEDMTISRHMHTCSGRVSNALIANGTDNYASWVKFSEEYDGTSWIASAPNLKYRARGCSASYSTSTFLDISGYGYPEGSTVWSAVDNVELYSKGSLYNLTAGDLTIYLTYCYT